MQIIILRPGPADHHSFRIHQRPPHPAPPGAAVVVATSCGRKPTRQAIFQIVPRLLPPAGIVQPFGDLRRTAVAILRTRSLPARRRIEMRLRAIFQAQPLQRRLPGPDAASRRNRQADVLALDITVRVIPASIGPDQRTKRALPIRFRAMHAPIPPRPEVLAKPPSGH